MKLKSITCCLISLCLSLCLAAATNTPAPPQNDRFKTQQNTADQGSSLPEMPRGRGPGGGMRPGENGEDMSSGMPPQNNTIGGTPSQGSARQQPPSDNAQSQPTSPQSSNETPSFPDTDADGNATPSPTDSDTSPDDTVTDSPDSEAQFMHPENAPGRGGMMQENMPGMFSETSSVSNPFLDFVKKNFTHISCVVLLALGFVFVIFYKKNSY